MQQGRHAARVVRDRLRDRPPGRFRYRDKGNLATIGRASAVAEVKGVRLSGLLALDHLADGSPAVPDRLREPAPRPIRWAFSFITHGRGARLITGKRNHRATADIEPMSPHAGEPIHNSRTTRHREARATPGNHLRGRPVSMTLRAPMTGASGAPSGATYGRDARPASSGSRPAPTGDIPAGGIDPPGGGSEPDCAPSRQCRRADGAGGLIAARRPRRCAAWPPRSVAWDLPGSAWRFSWSSPRVARSLSCSGCSSIACPGARGGTAAWTRDREPAPCSRRGYRRARLWRLAVAPSRNVEEAASWSAPVACSSSPVL